MKPLIAAALLSVLPAVSAVAETVCMEHAEMKATLVDWYGEAPRGPVSEDGTQLWVSDNTGSWTVVQPLSDGNACVVAQGSDWMTDGADARTASLQ